MTERFASNRLLRCVRAAARFLALAAPAGLAAAQALPTATGPGARIDVGAAASAFVQPYGQQRVGGTTFYADLYPHWRVALEVEARTLDRNTAQDVTLSQWLGGVKVPLRLRPGRWEPYTKLMAGRAHIVLPYRYATGNFFEYAPGAGLEVRLGDFVRVRAVDFEYGRVSGFPWGELHPYGITTGIAFRLNALRRFPDGHTRHGRIAR